MHCYGACQLWFYPGEDWSLLGCLWAGEALQRGDGRVPVAICTAGGRAEMETSWCSQTQPPACVCCHTPCHYEWFATMQQDSCKDILALTGHAHIHTLVALALLVEKMEHMSHSLSCQCSGSCQHSRSHSGWRSWSLGWQGEDPQVMSFHKDACSPSQQEACDFHWGPSSSDNSLERNAGFDRALQTPQPTWGTEDAMRDDSNWLRVEGGEDELECPPPLELHLQELLSGEEMSLAGTVVDNGLSWTLAPNDPEPSPMEKAEWISLYALQVVMPDWWWERWEVPGQDDHWEFAHKVQALFELPKAWSHVMEVDNDHSTPLAPSYLEKYKFMSPSEPQFSSQDYQLVQPQKTLAYTKVLQHWVEKAQNAGPQQDPPFGRECVAASMGDGAANLLHGWRGSQGHSILQLGGDQFTPTGRSSSASTGQTSSIRLQPEQRPPGSPQGVLSAAHGKIQSVLWTTTTQMTSQTTLTWEVVLQLAKSESQPPTPLPGFLEIVQSQWGDNLPSVITGIPAEEANPPAHMRLWDQCWWQLNLSNTLPQVRCSWTWSAALSA